MKENLDKKVVVATLLVGILMVISTVGMSTLANDDGTATLLIEVEDQEQIQKLEETGILKIDYDNGRAIIEVPEKEVETYERNYETHLDNTRYNINLGVHGKQFDRRNGMPDLQTDLKGDTNLYVVQFIGPIQSAEWKNRLTDAGADVKKEMMNYAMLTQMDTNTKREVESMDIVSWVGQYHSGYKMPSSLAKESGTLNIQVTPWAQSDMQSIKYKLNEIGATVGRTNGVGVSSTIDSSLLSTIAGWEEVERIDEYSAVETHDNVANEIHEVHGLWYTGWSGLSSRITGAGEVVGIQDTGFDEGNQDDGNPDFFGTDANPNDRVIRYTDQGGGSDPDGINSGTAHGTHCAGIVGSTGWSWETYEGYDTTDTVWHKGEGAGVAPEVEFSLDGCWDNSGSGGGLQTDHAYWDDQEADGAKIFSNSWGQGSGDYGTNSEDIDNRIDTDNERLILFSAGNDGPELHTISPRPQAKNGLGVGASQNFRTDWYSAENPNKVADFSSRGGPDFSNGRLKPDLVGVGTAQISGFSRGEWDYYVNNDMAVPQPGWIQKVDEYDYNALDDGSDGIADYRYMQGTSMSCPQVAGMSALTREYYKDIHGQTTVNSQLVKATLINGADRMDSTLYDYPGYDQGWGRVNMRKSLYPDAPQSNQFAEGTFTGTGTWDAATDGGMSLDVNSGDVPFKASLVWVDSQGIDLNRQLHMEATSPSGDTYISNNYNDNGWTIADAGGTVDTVNNTQRIEVQEPENGTWSLTVSGDSIPSDANFALVISGDFGPQDTYDVDLQTDYPTTMSVVAGGQTNLPIQVKNWGNTDDTINLASPDAPSGLSLSFDPSSSLSLASEEEQDVEVFISADAGLTTDVYTFSVEGTSEGDTSVKDTLRFTVQVLTEKLPTKVLVTNESVDESYADVETFTSADGTDYIFVSYLYDTTEGQQIRVKYTTLDTNGMPVEPWNGPYNPMSGDPTPSPSWIKLTHIPQGDLQDRVMISWNGMTPGSYDDTAGTYDSEGKVAYADFGAYDTWTTVQMNNDFGSESINSKRGQSLVWRDDGTTSGELLYTFEHVDSADVESNPSGIGIAYATSDDGGETWNAADDVPNCAPGGDYYFFFPDTITDSTMTTSHMYYYYRSEQEDSRMIVSQVYDGSWGGAGSDGVTDVVGDLADGDNHQFPRATSLEVDGTNYIYVSCLYDHGGTTDATLQSAYISGTYSSGSPPADGAYTTTGDVAASFITQAGYIDSNILSTTATGDNWVWTGYQEGDTAFDTQNIDSARTDDQYASTTVDKVTRDNYPKLNPQMSSLTTGDGVSHAYLTYHSSHGTIKETDYNIYLTVYHSSWESDADTEGPEASQVSAQPNPVDLNSDTDYDLTATIDDSDTGFSGIQDAQYMYDSGSPSNPTSDPTTLDWSGATYMTVSGSSQIETAEATGISIPSDWSAGNTYRVWVRGQDDQGNWGTENAGYVDIEVTESNTSSEPTYDVFNLGTLSSSGDGWNFVSFNLEADGDNYATANDLLEILEDTEYGISGNYDKVMYYDVANDEWNSYMPSRDTKFNDLETWDRTMGVWIQMNTDETLEVEGTAPTSTDIQLQPGWNMVSYPSSTNSGGSNSNLPGEVTNIGYFDANADYNLAYDNDPANFDFIPGEGYWVYSTGSATWTVDY